MKIIHCSDLHLGAALTTRMTPEKAAERRAELLAGFGRLADYAGQHDVEAILIAGDLFDVRFIDSHTRSYVLDVIRMHSNIDFYYLKGNHDTEDLHDPDTEDLCNLYLFNESGWTSYPVKDSRVVISGIEIGSGRSGSGQVEVPAFPEDQINLVMMHGELIAYGHGIGNDRIAVNDLIGKNIHYLALGHIHSFGSGRIDGKGVWCNPGSLEGHGFDECGRHGFVMLDIYERTGTIISEFVPFASCEYHICQSDISECESYADIYRIIDESLMNAGQPGSKDYVRIELTGQAGSDLDISTAVIEHHLADRFAYIEVLDKSTAACNYQAMEEDQSLKGEFIRQVRASHLTEERKAEVIKAGITILNGGQPFS